MNIFSRDLTHCRIFLRLIKLNESLFSEAEGCNFIKKEALAQVLSCGLFKIAKNIFSFRTPPAAASVMTFAFQAGETLPSKRKWSYF